MTVFFARVPAEPLALVALVAGRGERMRLDEQFRGVGTGKAVVFEPGHSQPESGEEHRMCSEADDLSQHLMELDSFASVASSMASSMTSTASMCSSSFAEKCMHMHEHEHEEHGTSSSSNSSGNNNNHNSSDSNSSSNNSNSCNSSDGDGEQLQATHLLHRCTEEHFSQQFAHVRKKLDAAFHGWYTRSRQMVQDQVVSYILRASGSMRRQEAPCIIFTAGGMGVGKSHCLRHLKREKVLPDLDSYVIIDQDDMRSLLPEWGEYSTRSKRAGSLLQKETGYMSEIALTECLNARRNIILDSSLKDTEWWKSEFARLKAAYPAYRIAILYMRTELQTAFERAEARAAGTGRSVPRTDVEDSFRRSAHSFRELRAHAHIAAEVDTTTQAPLFCEPSLEDFKRSWRDIASLPSN